MNQFVFEKQQKSTFIGMMILGVICMVLTFVGDDAFHTRFWSNFLHNSVYFTGIAFGALFVLSASLLAYGGWHTIFKRVWEAYSLFLIVGLVLMGVIVAGVLGGFHHLYHWADKASVEADEILKGKSGFLNPMIYTIFTIGFVGIWFFIAQRMRAISQDEDQNGNESFSQHKKLKFWAAIFLPLGGFSSAAIIWQWVMSLDAHWYSTLFAWYCTASMVVTMYAFTLLILVYLRSKGYYTLVTQEHLHDIGKYIFGISIFWTYLWFSQFMLIWYANVGEETIYFKTRLEEYRPLFFLNLGINFFIPFLVLIRNDTKRKVGSLVFVSIIVILGHWLNFFLMIKPGVLHTAHELAHHDTHKVGGNESEIKMHSVKTSQENHADANSAPHTAAATHGEGHEVVSHDSHSDHAEVPAGFHFPGLLEIGTWIGFLGLFLYFVFWQLTKARLTPPNDPFVGESYHHHV